MAKYLVRASYTQSGTQGLVKDGGAVRRRAVEELAKQAGGRLEAFYFAFGSDDLYAIFDMPSGAAMAAAALVVSALGVARVSTTVLITPEEMDGAAEKARAITYRPPGT